MKLIKKVFIYVLVFTVFGIALGAFNSNKVNALNPYTRTMHCNYCEGRGSYYMCRSSLHPYHKNDGESSKCIITGLPAEITEHGCEFCDITGVLVHTEISGIDHNHTVTSSSVSYNIWYIAPIISSELIKEITYYENYGTPQQKLVTQTLTANSATFTENNIYQLKISCSGGNPIIINFTIQKQPISNSYTTTMQCNYCDGRGFFYMCRSSLHPYHKNDGESSKCIITGQPAEITKHECEVCDGTGFLIHMEISGIDYNHTVTDSPVSYNIWQISSGISFDLTKEITYYENYGTPQQQLVTHTLAENSGTFTENNIYQLKISCSFGNQIIINFTINKTTPMIYVKEYSQGQESARIYNHGTTSAGAKVTLGDNIVGNNMKYTLYTPNGDVITGSVESKFIFWRKGRYVIEVTDMAGNKEVTNFTITSYSLLLDPATAAPYIGTEVTVNGGQYGGTTITGGYTRCIYLDGNAPSQSRLDYHFTSSDESIARVSAYGTITAIAPGVVTIYVVHKNNPSLQSQVTITVLP